MITPVKVNVEVITDNTGIECCMPAIVTEQGLLNPLLDYFLSHSPDRSISWMRKVTHATYLLMQYMEANQDCFSNPKDLFQSFASRLYTGTINEAGLDPSHLYWLPPSTKTTNGIINALTGLTDWLSENSGVVAMNPLRRSDSFEKRLQYAAWFRRNQHDFLGHINDKSINDTICRARHINGKRTLSVIDGDAIAFPESLFKKFFSKGIGGALDRRVVVRNQLILLMMHFTGCRLSDCLSLWVHDVSNDINCGVLLRLYHPEDGRAPNGWRSRSGSTTRAAYLRENYALTPRNRLNGTKHVGWKNKVVDHADNYIQLHWFPTKTSHLFSTLWREYLIYLAYIDRSHPYAFVSFETKTCGSPLTINSFNDAYEKALYRIGEEPSKAEGRSPHAHRHAMGRRLDKANVHERIIQKVLHHKSIHSQAPYTTPGIRRVTEALNKGSINLEEMTEQSQDNNEPVSWESLIEHGFEDIDPDGLYSGRKPIYGKYRG